MDLLSVWRHEVLCYNFGGRSGFMVDFINIQHYDRFIGFVYYAIYQYYAGIELHRNVYLIHMSLDEYYFMQLLLESNGPVDIKLVPGSSWSYLDFPLPCTYGNDRTLFELIHDLSVYSPEHVNSP